MSQKAADQARLRIVAVPAAIAPRIELIRIDRGLVRYPKRVYAARPFQNRLGDVRAALHNGHAKFGCFQPPGWPVLEKSQHDVMRLRDRIALITGAAQGIGAAIAEEFAKEGAIVYAIDRAAHVEQLAHRLQASGAKCVPVQLDLTDHSALKTCIDDVVASESGIDILVNNAAICYYEDLFDSSLEHWRETQAVNLEAQYAACKLVAPHMARRKWGRIVNIASTQAISTEPRVGAYAASKGAIVTFTKSLAIELAPHGINANAIAPGCIHTPMSVINGVDETTTELFQTWYVKARKIPLARPGEPSEIARVAVFLASDDSAYVTGIELFVDGGAAQI